MVCDPQVRDERFYELRILVNSECTGVYDRKISLLKHNTVQYRDD